jgi:hypothetical protein
MKKPLILQENERLSYVVVLLRDFRNFRNTVCQHPLDTPFDTNNGNLAATNREKSVQKSLLHFLRQCVKIKIQKDCRFAMAAVP